MSSNNHPKVDWVEREILRLVNEGELPPGTVIQQRDLAKQLDVSPTPVREAFRRLEMAGVLQPNARGGVRVAEAISSADEAMQRVRVALEHLGVDLLMQRVTPENLVALRALNRRYIDGPLEEVAAVHWQLHLDLFDIAQTPILKNHLRVLWSLLETQGGRRSRAESGAHHAAILDAIEAGDSELVKALMDEHHSRKP